MLSESGLPTRCSTCRPRAHLPKVQAHVGYDRRMKPLTMGPEEHHDVNGRFSVPLAVLRTALTGLDSPIGGGGSRNYAVEMQGARTPSKNPRPVSVHKHTFFIFVVVTFYELRLYGVLRSALAVTTPFGPFPIHSWCPWIQWGSYREAPFVVNCCSYTSQP
jgi:hypothetical protein